MSTPVSRPSERTALSAADNGAREREPGPSAARHVADAWRSGSWVPGLAPLARDTMVPAGAARPFSLSLSLSSSSLPSLTMSNSAVFFVPAAHFSAPGFWFPLSHLRRFRPRTRGWAERRETRYFSCRAGKARRHACEAWARPVQRDDASRRSAVAIFGPGPRFPSPAFAAGSAARTPYRQDAYRQACRRRTRPGPPRGAVTSRGPRDATSPLRLQDRLRRRPS